MITAVALCLVSVCEAVAASSVSQHGVTWSFDRDYPTGQFANGDFWVVGPVTLTRITPNDTNLSDGVDLHGAVVNPIPGQKNPSWLQGWDSRVPNTTYDRNLNIARKLPLRLNAGSSVVSVISDTAGDAPGSDRTFLQHSAVLTVVASAPAAGSFRPAYAGTDKTIYGNAGSLNTSYLRTFAPVSGAPAISNFNGAFTQPLLDIIPQWANSDLKSAGAGPSYGKDIACQVGDAVLALNLNTALSQKHPLLVRVIQRGIDTYGLAKAGMVWFPNGGHNTGRKLPLLIAGLSLQRSDMMEWADAGKHFIFQEDMQHYFVSQVDVSTPRSPSTLSPFTSSMIGMAEWASNPITERNKTGSEWDKKYRNVNGAVDTGLVLAAELMGLRRAWNHEPLFDYINKRYWPKESATPTSSVVIPAFHRAMWSAYRSQAASGTPAPSAPTPAPAPTSPAPTPTPDDTATVGIWQNLGIGSKTSGFSCSFEMMPSQAPMEGYVGLSNGAADALTDLAAVIRFAPNGTIEALNGSSFQAKNVVRYAAGQRYKVTIWVDFSTKVYSVAVTPPNASTSTPIAERYAFRSTLSSLGTLSNVGFVTATGSQSVMSLTTAALTATPSPAPTPVAATLANGSFENGLTGWSASGNVESLTAGNPYTARNGGKLVVFNGGQRTPNGVLAQTLATTAGRSYTVTVDVGVLAYNRNQQSLLISAQGSSALGSKTVTVAGKGGGTPVWTTATLTFTANSSSTTITFRDVSSTGDSLDLTMDNVRVN